MKQTIKLEGFKIKIDNDNVRVIFDKPLDVDLIWDNMGVSNTTVLINYKEILDDSKST